MAYPFTYLTRFTSRQHGKHKCNADSGTMRSDESPQTFLQRYVEHVFYKALPSIIHKDVELILSNNEYVLMITIYENKKMKIVCSTQNEPQYCKLVQPVGNSLHIGQNTKFKTIQCTNASAAYITPMAWLYAIFPNIDTVNDIERSASVRL